MRHAVPRVHGWESAAGDVTFWGEIAPGEAMESLVSFVDTRVSVKTLYRADAERLWNALCAFSGDPDIASDAVSEAYAQLLHRGGAVANPVAWTWRAAFHIAGRRLSGPFDLLDGRYLGSGPDLGSWRPTAPP